ncbi:ABC transporter ATP-binding protein [Acidipropionibacterium virtanenii]|uniref:HMP/thiamine import ATP-binding protein YkoD n=1 Tax=Acidipropionibacterium virtanenii TaxID=2057246 RepID=A0A344USC0_9ACTN|nr:ABC transporter ATP-binding protein [Acidipropionibacterium virtanenii]AXE38168.1 Putative HMP/thiamine import ATP-binding protein YkoD [Acidipropionibacterium virtanenii]
MTAPALVLDDVSITLPDADRPVLSHLNLAVREGDLALVVGRTGSGKSTLLGALNGLVPHFSGGRLDGSVTVAGLDTRSHRPRDLADVIGVVGQNPMAGFVTDTVEDEIAYGMEQLGISSSIMRKRVEETLDLLNIADLRSRPLLDLSGGQQQRVAIASVLAAQPRILVLDEPTSALDPTAAQDVLASITTLVDDVGLTVVLAEHRLERVMHAADTVIWLPGDSTAVQGDPSEVLLRADVTPPLAQLARVLGWDSVPLSVRRARRRVRAAGQVPARSAPEPTEALSWAADPAADVMRLENLSVSYGDLNAVDRVDLTLQSGTVTTLMGRNGAGKSSLMWAVQGATRSSGSVRVRSSHTASGGDVAQPGWTDPRTASPEQARRLVTLVPQAAADLLYLPSVGAECQQADRESEADPGTTASILHRLGVELPAERDPRDLSEGQRLALVLAIQLAARPSVVLLDEPTRGLDYAMKAQLSLIVRAIADGSGLAGPAGSPAAVLISTHDVEFAAMSSDRTVVMADGQIVADGTTRSVCTSSPAFSPQMAKVFHPADLLTPGEVAEAMADPSVDLTVERGPR